MVTASPSNTGDAGSVPGRGAKISCASWPKKKKNNTEQNIKQKHYCNESNKGFKNGPHPPKNLFLKIGGSLLPLLLPYPLAPVGSCPCNSRSDALQQLT